MLCRWLQLSDYMRGLGYEGVAQAKAAAGGSDFMLALFFRPVSCFVFQFCCFVEHSVLLKCDFMLVLFFRPASCFPCQFCCFVEHTVLLKLPATSCVANCFRLVG